MRENNVGDTPQHNGRGKSRVPKIVAVARGLFYLLGVIWLAFGVSSIACIGDASSSVPVAVFWIIAILMFVNALLLIWVGWGIGRGSRPYFYFGLILLAANIFLTFTDEFGVFDLITLSVNVVLLVLLILGRSKFLQNN